MNREKLLTAAIAITVGCSLLSYWVKPKAPRLDLVQPQQVLASYHATYPGDTSLSDRVIKSYTLAMVLVQSPYVQTNMTALEAVRQWARQEFQAHPDFLHPISLSPSTENNDTVFGALGYNLFAAMRYWLEERTGEALATRISQFHKSDAYTSFKSAYFDFFGEDNESAILLARYESARAKQAIDVVLWCFAWLATLAGGLLNLCQSTNETFGDRLRVFVGSVWALLGVIYLSQAWMTGSSATLLSSVFSAAIAGYLWRPMALISHAEARQRLVRIHLTRRSVALAAWFTVSALAIQILTWIRTSVPGAEDPVSLSLSALTGNFIHDPTQSERVLATSMGVIWSLATVWTWTQRNRMETGGTVSDNSFDTLASPELLEGAKSAAEHVK